MCFFEQTTWTCGMWKWGRFREKCPKETRTGETCGLRLVYITMDKPEVCHICELLNKKYRRMAKWASDIERWQREGDRPATIARGMEELAALQEDVAKLYIDHNSKELVPRIPPCFIRPNPNAERYIPYIVID
ncbi:hypothetical protein HJFPF1_11028 [Paramyrothecium foliicola]|nr:hypothetical protein HJFPF1_11028 [Paramyrothecium foliicola]